jgi:hypothetical protein
MSVHEVIVYKMPVGEITVDNMCVDEIIFEQMTCRL